MGKSINLQHYCLNCGQLLESNQADFCSKTCEDEHKKAHPRDWP